MPNALPRAARRDARNLVLPQARTEDGHVWHIYSVIVRGKSRDLVRETMAADGVATGVHYPTLVPYQPVYAHLGLKPGAFPIAEDLFGNCLSLPMYPEPIDGRCSSMSRRPR